MWQEEANKLTHGHTSKFLLFWAALFRRSHAGVESEG